jgi:hypothetical protein
MPIRHLLGDVKIKFSIATKRMESAIIGSTMSGGATTIFFILITSVIECATVNAVDFLIIVFILVVAWHEL